jgi:hypothetical protein
MRRTALGLAAALSLLSANGSSVSRGSITQAAEAAEPEPCIPLDRVVAYAVAGGTAVLSVVPEGLPAEAVLVSTVPCATFLRTSCHPDETPLYFVPCAAAGPGVCGDGAAYLAACYDVGVCPTTSSPSLFWTGIDRCPIGGLTNSRVVNSVRCPDGTAVKRELLIFITLPADCDRSGTISDAELDQTVASVFDNDRPWCADLNLDGRTTADELQKVWAYVLRDRATGEACPLPGPTPEPSQFPFPERG